MSEASNFEQLLRSALVPVDPPAEMTDRLERTLTELTDAAAGELADWELSAMRDPRNWGRTVAAAGVVAGAGAALALVRARQQHQKRNVQGLRALEDSVRGVLSDVEKRLGR
ncbi:MAG TPA: hypothetical protein VNT32_10895 [Thermoleophilaceae bacterium]|nr:hypothetical protein [Thermoleophilaceae bacterium]